MSDRPAPLKAALLGLGRIAWRLEDDPRREKPATHLGALRRLSGVTLAGGWDSDPAARADCTRRWKLQTDFSGAEDLLARIQPDLVCVATWPDSHEALVRLCVESGVAAVVCEKPLADSLAAARRLAALDRTGPAATRILVNHERRYARDYAWARALLGTSEPPPHGGNPAAGPSAGPLGPVRAWRARSFLGRRRPAALTLLHDGTHLIDILRFLSGAELQAEAVTGDGRAPGGVLTWLGRLGEAPLVLEVGGGREAFVFELEADTEGGRVVIGNGRRELWRSRPAPWATGFRSLHKLWLPPLGPSRYFAGLMEDAAACARDSRRRPLSSASDGLAALETMESLLGLAGLSLDEAAALGAVDAHKPQ